MNMNRTLLKNLNNREGGLLKDIKEGKGLPPIYECEGCANIAAQKISGKTCTDVECEIWGNHDPVNHPSHYTFGNIEVIDYMKDKLSSDEFYGFCIGNCIKYISRAKHKGKTLEDLKKAEWYLHKIIGELENESGQSD